jgi:hypothetical protein
MSAQDSIYQTFCMFKLSIPTSSCIESFKKNIYKKQINKLGHNKMRLSFSFSTIPLYNLRKIHVHCETAGTKHNKEYKVD